MITDIGLRMATCQCDCRTHLLGVPRKEVFFFSCPRSNGDKACLFHWIELYMLSYLELPYTVFYHKGIQTKEKWPEIKGRNKKKKEKMTVRTLVSEL